MPRANKCKSYKERGRRTAVRLYAMQQNERNTALYEAILRLNSLDECIRFFDDLCAVTELRTMEQRYAVAGCLLQGKVYSEILERTGASSATISRVNRCLTYGAGGYQLILGKTKFGDEISEGNP